jgi:ASC-1-like (ASCH) protein
MLNLVVKQVYFDAIKTGSKTVEGRLNSPKSKDLKPGDVITFTCHEINEKISCVVTALNIYPDFEAMLVSEGIANMLSGIKNLAEGVAIYENFPGYQKGVKEFGAL